MNNVPTEVIVVEGKSDTRRLIEVYTEDIKTIETGGSALDESIYPVLQKAYETFGLIIFTDPDYSGLRIRRILEKKFPDAKHAYITQEEGKGQGVRRNLGVEYASDEAILEALNKAKGAKPKEAKSNFNKITLADLNRLGLVGADKASQLRDGLGEYFNIGHVNAKQLVKKLNMYEISLEEVEAFLKEVEVD